MDILESLRANLRLQEGVTVLEGILVEIGILGHTSTKQIARVVKLPVPLVAAIKNEFISAGLIRRDAKIHITPAGQKLLDQRCGFAGINLALYQELIDGRLSPAEALGEDYALLTRIFAERPRVDVTLDQSKSTLETSLQRALLALQYHLLIGKKWLCLGDDDLVSVATGMLLRRLYKQPPYATRLQVVDIDERFLEYIEHQAHQWDLPISCRLHDLRQPLPEELQKSFQVVFTDPPYTLAGVTLFLSRAAEALAASEELTVFLSFAHKPAAFQLEMQRRLTAMGFAAIQIIPGFNHYDGAEMIGNRSQMLVLKAVACRGEIDGDFPGLLYTGELNRSRRVYCCKQCRRRIFIGQEEEFTTIEELKAAHCPGCGGESFDLLVRIPKSGAK